MSDLSICYPAKQNVTKMSNESMYYMFVDHEIGNYKSRKMYVLSKVFEVHSRFINSRIFKHFNIDLFC